MSQPTSKYSIEIFSSSGQFLADFSGLARDRRIIQSRNEAETIQWNIDLNDYHRYCSLAKIDPNTLLINNSTEIRAKRGGSYLCGGQLVYKYPRLTRNNQTMQVRATGFLNLLKDRYTGTTSAGSVSESFTATNGGTIASTLITETQALTNGDYGITIGSIASTGNHDKTYSETNIKDAIQALSKLVNNPFDFEFTYNKTFNTYASLGSNRPDIVFEWPNNIIDFGLPEDGTGTANQVTAYGQGFGEQARTAVEVNNAGSQLTYKLRQKKIISDGVDDSNGGITNAANSELAAWAFPYELPTLIVDGNRAPFVTDYGVGDRVKVVVRGHPILEHVNGLYRIEKRIIDIDDNDNETVELVLSA